MMSTEQLGVDQQALPPLEAEKANWYALYTCPRHEKRVAEQIGDRNLKCFVPLYRSVRRWKDRRKELELALFPGYVFVCMTLERRFQVLNLPGAVQFVSFSGKPAIIAPDEIELLRTRFCGVPGLQPHPYVQTGHRVRVRSGAMEGLEGIVVRRKDRYRIVFSVELLRQSVAIEVDESDLEVAS